MGVSVVATAPSDGSHLVAGNMTTTVSCSLLIPSRSTTDHSKSMMGMSLGTVPMDHGLDIVDH
jgi:hypothetical protein